MKSRFIVAFFTTVIAVRLAPLDAAGAPSEFRGVIVTAEQASADRLAEWTRAGFGAVSIALVGDATATRDAAERVRAAGLELDYFIEIARNEALASAHPEWMASLQGHSNWQRLFRNAGEPKAGEVVKNWPWVPILYRESFEAQLARVSRLLADVPAPAAIFLNDLQAAPSACGCGNVVCRWVPDYGPIETATRLSDDAAAKFVAAVGAMSPAARVVPIWTAECEEAEKSGQCGGLGCFHGRCWNELTAQFRLVAKESQTIGVLVLAKAFGHDDARVAWTKTVISSMVEQPAQHGGEAVPAKHVVAVLQGWDATPEQIEEQVAACRALGTGGHLVALTRIDQSWEPRIVPIPTKSPPSGEHR